MLKKILIGLVITLAVVIGLRNVIAKVAISTGAKAVAGLDVQLNKFNAGLLGTNVLVKDATVKQPAGFEGPLFVDLPEFYVDYNLGAILTGKIHLEELRLNLASITVVRNREGEYNFQAIKGIQKKEEAKPTEAEATPQEKKAAKPINLQIDKLKLTIGTVTVQDYSRSSTPKIKEYKLNIDQTYTNVNNPADLMKIIFQLALSKTPLAALANFDVDLKGISEDLSKQAGQLAGTAKEDLSGAAKAAESLGKETLEGATQTLKDTTQSIKNLIPFAKKEE